MDTTIICPGCGWTGTVETLDKWGACPKCGYENGLEPNRLLTLSEMLNGEGPYDEVDMAQFLKSLFRCLGYPDNRDEWADIMYLCRELTEDEWLEKDIQKRTRPPTE